MDFTKLERSMTNIKPNDDQIQRIEKLRESFKKAGESLFENCNQSREMSLAITKLEESLMWATKSIVLEA